jgi:hypothetical protein
MNLLVMSEAMSDVGRMYSLFSHAVNCSSHVQLETIRWEKRRLKDLVMLPAGIDPGRLP